MKQNNFIFKFLGATVLWIAGFSILAAISFNQAAARDPQIANKVIAKLGWNVTKHFIGWSIPDDPNGEVSAENQHQWKFQVPEQRMELKIINGDIEIVQGDGREIQVKASGLTAAGDSSQLLGTLFEAGNLQIYQPENLEIANLRIHIQIPKGFRGALIIKTVSGDIKVQDLALRSFEVKTVSGDLEITDVSAPEIEAKTVSGSVNLATEGIGQLKVQTVSGDVSLQLTEGEDVSYRLKSVSGDIRNEFRGSKKQGSEVSIQTMSGEISISKR
jgi:DUF4097 and DUF4098 domain-containing protein YvlB